MTSLKKTFLLLPLLIVGFSFFWISSARAQLATLATQCPTSNPAGTLVCDGKRFVSGQCRTEAEVTGMINVCTTSGRNEVFNCSTGACACPAGTRDCRGGGTTACLTPAQSTAIDTAGVAICTPINRTYNNCAAAVTAAAQCGGCIAGTELIGGECLSIGQVNTRVTTVDTRVTTVDTDVTTLEGQVTRLLGGIYTVTGPLTLTATRTGFDISLPVCAANQVLKKNTANTAWECADVLDANMNNMRCNPGAILKRTPAGSPTTWQCGVDAYGIYTAADGGGLSLAANGAFSLNTTGCVGGEVWKRNAGDTAWECVPDANAASQWATSGSNISYSTGNVGIGAAADPDTTLYVSGGVRFGEPPATNAALGDASFATGWQNAATAVNSFAAGANSTASGDVSIALGNDAAASSPDSVAIGTSVTASAISALALGSNMTVSGLRSVGIGLSTTAYTLSSANTMAIMGGNVGIGTAAPVAPLHLQSNTDSWLRLEADTDNTTEGDNAWIQLSQDGALVNAVIGTVGDAGKSPDSANTYTGTLANTTLFGTTTNYPVQLGTNGAVHITIQGDGKVGIEDTAPDVRLHIDNAGLTGLTDTGVYDVLKLSNTNSASATAPKGSNFTIGLSRWEDPGNNYPRTRVDFKTTGRTTDNNTTPNTIMSLRDDGNVGIGTANPSATLDINGNLKVGGFYFDGNDDTWLRLRDGDGGAYRDFAVNQLWAGAPVTLNEGVFFDCDNCGSTSDWSVTNGTKTWGNLAIQGRVLSASSNIHLSPPGGSNVIINDDYRGAGGTAGSGAGLTVEGNVGIGGNLTVSGSDAVLPTGSIDTFEIANGAINKDDFALGSVDTDAIATGAVTASDLAADSVKQSELDIYWTSVNSDIFVSGTVVGTSTAYCDAGTDDVISGECWTNTSNSTSTTFANATPSMHIQGMHRVSATLGGVLTEGWRCVARNAHSSNNYYLHVRALCLRQ